MVLICAGVAVRSNQRAEHHGYPEGGNNLSITKGIVSRVEFAPYNFPVFGLRIQVDAANRSRSRLKVKIVAQLRWPVSVSARQP